jgi:hypothetical protein
MGMEFQLVGLSGIAAATMRALRFSSLWGSAPRRRRLRLLITIEMTNNDTFTRSSSASARTRGTAIAKGNGGWSCASPAARTPTRASHQIAQVTTSIATGTSERGARRNKYCSTRRRPRSNSRPHSGQRASSNACSGYPHREHHTGNSPSENRTGSTRVVGPSGRPKRRAGSWRNSLIMKGVTLVMSVPIGYYRKRASSQSRKGS